MRLLGEMPPFFIKTYRLSRQKGFAPSYRKWIYLFSTTPYTGMRGALSPKKQDQSPELSFDSCYISIFA